MALKITKKGEALVVLNTETTKTVLKAIGSWFWYDINDLEDSDIVNIFPIKESSKYQPVRVKLSETLDVDDNPYTQESFQTFADDFLGKSKGGGNGNGVTETQLNAAISGVNDSISGVQNQIDNLPNSPLKSNRYILTQNNVTPFLEDGPNPMNFQNYSQVNNDDTLSTFDGTDLVITAGTKDVRIIAAILTDGEMDLDQKWHFRDSEDDIRTKLGDGSNNNTISSPGTYGKNSDSLEGAAVVSAGETITINLVYEFSQHNQRIQSRSYIEIKEIV